MKSTTLTTIGYCLVYAGILAGMVSSYFTGTPDLVDELANFSILVGISLATGTLANQVDATIQNNPKAPNSIEIGKQVLDKAEERKDVIVEQNGNAPIVSNSSEDTNQTVRRDIQS